jgi:(R)-3-[(carboxymethyl)amino]fatty acid dioxygenase/decarboxylase
MKISAQVGEALGVTVEGFAAGRASAEDIAALKKAVYTNKIVVLKGQDLTSQEVLALGRLLGRAEHHQPVYCEAGQFWHSNRHLTATPFDLSVSYPRLVPTYFIDMAAAYERLSDELKLAVQDVIATYGVLRYAMLGPRDKNQTLAGIVNQVNTRTPPVEGPAAARHPVTGETVLHVSEGFTMALRKPDGLDRPELLAALLEATGQLDPTYRHPNIHLQTFSLGDLLVWDNHSLIHRAADDVAPEPVVSVYDE